VFLQRFVRIKSSQIVWSCLVLLVSEPNARERVERKGGFISSLLLLLSSFVLGEAVSVPCKKNQHWCGLIIWACCLHLKIVHSSTKGRV
jgi:hypothetical protein